MPAKRNKNIDTQLQLSAIELLKSSVNMPVSPDLALTNFVFKVNLENRVDKEQSLVFIITEVEIMNNDQDILLGSLTSSCIFKVMNFAELVNIDPQGMVHIPQQLMEILNSISISTTRGLMFATFKGTFLHNAFLPIIDPGKIYNVTRSEG